MKTPRWKKWICILSNFIASSLSRSICQTCATIPGVEFLRTLSMFIKLRKENLSSYVHVLHKTSCKEVLHRSWAKSMSKKCTNVWCKSRATSFPGFSLFPGERTLVEADHPVLFLQALRFWELRDQPPPGFFLKARERSLGTRLRAELRLLI